MHFFQQQFPKCSYFETFESFEKFEAFETLGAFLSGLCSPLSVLSLGSLPYAPSFTHHTSLITLHASRQFYFSVSEYIVSAGGLNLSLIDLAETHLRTLRYDPALSLVPEALAPPKGCCPTMAPVGLSLM